MRARYRHLRRTAIAALASVALLVVVVVLTRAFLSSTFVRERALAMLEDRAARLGLDLEAGELSWELLPPALCLDRVRLEAPGFEAEARRVRLDLGRVRLAARLVELDTVSASGVRLRFAGLPSRQARPRPWVRLAVRILELRDVAVEGQNLPGGLALTLREADAGWVSPRGEPRGFFRARAGRLEVPGLEPVDFRLEGRFALAGGVAVPRFRLNGRGFDLAGSGQLSEAGPVRAEAEGTLDLAELDRVVRAGGILKGTCNVTASLATDRTEAVQVKAWADRVSAAGFPVAALEGQLVLRGDGLVGTVEHARFCGGSLTGTYRLGRLAAPFPHRVEVHGQGLDLGAFLGLIGVPPANLGGRVRADAELEWEGLRIKNGAGRAEAKVEPAPDGLAVSGTVQAMLTPDGLIHFAASDLGLGSSTVTWQGPLTVGEWEPAWSVSASPAALDEVVPLVNSWVGTEVLPPGIGGSGDLNLTLAGPWQRLRVDVRVDAHPLLYSGVRLDRVVAEGVVQGSSLELYPSRYQVGDGGGTVSGRLAWGEEAGDDQLRLDLEGQGIPLSRVGSWLGVESGCAGLASFTGGLRGPLAAGRGSWALGLTEVELGGFLLGDGTATVSLTDATFAARGLSFSTGLSGSVWWAVGSSEVGGDLVWPAVPAEALTDPFLRLLGSGSRAEASFYWPLDGLPTGRLSARSATSELAVEADPDTVSVRATLPGRTTATVHADRRADGALEGHGEVELGAAGALVAALFPEARLPLEGSGDASFDLKWAAGEAPRVVGVLRRLELELADRPLRLVEPAPFSLSDAGLSLDRLRLSLLGDEVFLRCAVRPDGALTGNLTGTFDALLLRFLLPEWEPAGRATGIVELVGTVDRPGCEGVVQVEQGSFRLPGSRTVLSGVSGTLLLSTDEVILDQVGFRAMGGSGRCSGRIGVRDGAVVIALEGKASGVEVPLLPGLFPRLGGTFRLEGTPPDLELAGKLTVERAALRRKDDLATILVDWMAAASVPSTGGDLRLDLHLEADRTIEAHSPFVRLVGSASLEVSGTLSHPGAVGMVELEEGGELTFQGVRYELEHCSVAFSDPLRVEPIFDLEVRTLVQSYQITVRLSGSTDRLVPSLSSDPPLPEDEIWSLLALGRRDEAIGGGAVGVGLASTMLTRELNAELERRARDLLAVDQVRVDPFAETSTGNPTARVTVVKQVSPSWTVILQSNLSGNRQEVVVSRWSVGPGLFVEATRDLDGTLAVDLKLRRRY